MYGAPTPPAGQFGITSAPGGMQRPGMGITPGGFPAQPGRPMPQAPAFTPPVPSMGQLPNYMNALQGNPARPPVPGGLLSGMEPVPASQVPQVPGQRSQGPAVRVGNATGPLDRDALMAWVQSLPRPDAYRTENGFDRAGWQAAFTEWRNQSPWASLGGQGIAAGEPNPAAPPMSQPIANPTMPGMVGSSYNVGGLVPGANGFQLPTYNIGG